MKRTELMQTIARCDQPHPRWRILQALVSRALAVQDRCTYAAIARPDGRQSATMYGGGPAIQGLLGAIGRHLERGLKHVPGVTGLARSQAPPIWHMGGASNRSRHTSTAVR
jgi:hypothetical protein